MFPIIFTLSEILPVILYLCFVRRNRNQGLQVIFTYCLVSFITEYLFLFLRHRIPEFYLYSSFTICEYTFFTLFLYLSLKGKVFRIILIMGTLIFYTMAAINITDKKQESFDSLSASGEAILIIVYSILFLYEQIRDPAVIFVYNTKKFWIVIAFFIYFSSTLFLFIYAETFTKAEHKNYWYINNIFDILKNIFFCVAFTMKPDRKDRYSVENLYTDM